MEGNIRVGINRVPADVPLGRQIRLSFLRSLIQTKSLYAARLDRFRDPTLVGRSDPDEAWINESDLMQQWGDFLKLLSDDHTTDPAELDAALDTIRRLKLTSFAFSGFAVCFTYLADASTHSWERYEGDHDEQNVLLTTSGGRVWSALPSHARIAFGPIEYIDQAADSRYAPGRLVGFCKPKAFADESEVRLLAYSMPGCYLNVPGLDTAPIFLDVQTAVENLSERADREGLSRLMRLLDVLARAQSTSTRIDDHVDIPVHPATLIGGVTLAPGASQGDVRDVSQLLVAAEIDVPITVAD